MPYDRGSDFTVTLTPLKHTGFRLSLSSGTEAALFMQALEKAFAGRADVTDAGILDTPEHLRRHR